MFVPSQYFINEIFKTDSVDMLQHFYEDTYLSMRVLSVFCLMKSFNIR